MQPSLGWNAVIVQRGTDLKASELSMQKTSFAPYPICPHFSPTQGIDGSIALVVALIRLLHDFKINQSVPTILKLISALPHLGPIGPSWK